MGERLIVPGKESNAIPVELAVVSRGGRVDMVPTGELWAHLPDAARRIPAVEATHQDESRGEE